MPRAVGKEEDGAQVRLKQPVAEARARARRDLAGHERVGQRHLHVLPQLLGHKLVRGVRRVRQRDVSLNQTLVLRL